MQLSIRCDDVLQINPVTKAQREALKEKSFFKWFKEADEIFKKYNYPMILAVCSEGIKKCPEWAEYIEENQHRYKIELHCSAHHNYSGFSKDDLWRDLAEAKELIEEAFNCEITTWYIPFGRPGKNQYGEEVCKKLGIKYDVPKGKIGAKEWLYNQKKGTPLFQHINFHYWDRGQVGAMEEILKQIGGNKNGIS